MSATLLGNRAFADIIKLKWGHTKLEGAQEWCPYNILWHNIMMSLENSEMEPKKTRLCENSGRDWSNTDASQGVPRTAN